MRKFVSAISKIYSAKTKIPQRTFGRNQKENRKKVKIVMLVGKYYSKDFNEIEAHIRLAEQYAIKLWNLGFGVFTPHLNTCHFEVKTRVPEKRYQQFDAMALERLADCLFALPNWRQSRGGKQEVAKAIKLGIPVFEDFQSICNWRDGKKPIYFVDNKKRRDNSALLSNLEFCTVA